MIILDTNVVSELVRAESNRNVVGWATSTPRSELAITAITLAELRYGVARLPAGRRRSGLEMSIDRMIGRFSNRIEPFDANAAEQYGSIVAEREQAGRRIDFPDAQIAAICRSLGATLATRNTKDFADTGIDVVDPWQA